MKRLAIAAVAALTMVGPLSVGAAYADPPGNYRSNDRNDRNDRHDSRRDNDRNDHRANQRERWEQSRHNGYYVNGRYYRGAPSAAIQRRADFRPAWQNWRRGERLPAHYRTSYREVDYRRAHLRAPPRGQHYVRDDHGNTLLVAVATGLIVSVLLSQ